MVTLSACEHVHSNVVRFGAQVAACMLLLLNARGWAYLVTGLGCNQLDKGAACPADYSASASGFAQLVSLHSAATVTLRMTTPAVIVFNSYGPGQCAAGVLVNIVVSKGKPSTSIFQNMGFCVVQIIATSIVCAIDMHEVSDAMSSINPCMSLLSYSMLP